MSKLFIDKNLKALIGTIIKVITKISKNFSKLLLEKASKLFIDKRPQSFYFKENFKDIIVDVATDYRKLRSFEQLW